MSESSAGRDAGAGTGGRAGADTTDFPDFVSDLMRGVYNAVMNASIQQMEAYARLVKEVADSVDGFLVDVARTGTECLDGLCSGRAWASTGASRGGRPKRGDSAAEQASGGGA